MMLKTGARRREAAELDLLDLGCDAGHRCAHHGMIQIALGLVQRRLGQGIGRKFLDRQLGIAEQLRGRGRHLLPQQLQLGAGGDEAGRGVVEVEL